VPTGRHGSFRKKQTHRQRRILNSNLQISCQDLPFPDGFDLKNKSKPWIRSVDYYLECCIEARFLKLASTGRKRWKSGLQVLPTKCGDRVVAKVDDLRLEERVTRLCGGG
jgi:hypothetical protein